LTQFLSVVSLAVGRLKDKSVVVVKNAIQLLAAFLSNNPYSCKVIPINRVDMLEVCLQAEYLQYGMGKAVVFPRWPFNKMQVLTMQMGAF